MKKLTFFIPGKVKPQARPRTITKGKGGRPLGFARTFIPRDTRDYQAWIKSCAMDAMNGSALMDGPLHLTVIIQVSPPKSWSGKRKSLAISGEIHPTKRPDRNNIEKALEDALNEIVWKDDAQIVRWTGAKIYSDDPGVAVTVSELPGMAAP